MESQPVHLDAEITRPPRPVHDAERLTTRVHPVPRLPAPPARPAAGAWAGRGASVGPHAIGRLTHWIAAYSVLVLRLSLGGLFFWFGLLKFFPAWSPAEALATRTLETLTLGYLAPPLFLPLLGLWETVIGLGLLLGVCPALTLGLLFLHLGGTLTPLVLFPQDMFAHLPYVPTFEAQYILKNVVLISAGCVIGAARRGRRTCDACQGAPGHVIPATTRQPRGAGTSRLSTEAPPLSSL